LNSIYNRQHSELLARQLANGENKTPNIAELFKLEHAQQIIEWHQRWMNAIIAILISNVNLLGIDSFVIAGSGGFVLTPEDVATITEKVTGQNNYYQGTRQIKVVITNNIKEAGAIGAALYPFAKKLGYAA